MRIAMFTNNYKPFIGGVPISIERLSNGLRKLGREVVVFAPDYGVCETEEHVVRYKTIYQKNRDGLMIGNCFDSKIERQFLEGRFDVIHVHHPMISGFAALYLEKKYGIPVAYTYHTRYEEYLHYLKFYNVMERHELSDGMASYLKTVLVPRYMTAFANSCDLVFAPTRMMKNCLGSYGVKTETTVLPTGLEDASFIERREENLVFTGKVPNEQIRDYLFAGDLFLFASRSETQGIVLLEAMAAGTPVVAVKASGVVDVVKNGVNGYMTEADEATWAEAVRTIVGQPEHFRELKHSSVQTALEYQSSRIAAMAARGYQEMLARYKTGKIIGLLRKSVWAA